MLAQIADDLAAAGGDHVGSVAQKDAALDLLARFHIAQLLVLVGGDGLVGQRPVQLRRAKGKKRGVRRRTWIVQCLQVLRLKAHHLVNLLDSQAVVGGLEARGVEAIQQLLVVHALVKVVT